VIRDRVAYEKFRVADEQRALRKLDMRSAAAMTEALLASNMLARVDRRRDPRPRNLVRSLGIDPRRVPRRAARATGRERL
jgi:hypothetical protein